jgi:hypothetical protein
MSLHGNITRPMIYFQGQLAAPATQILAMPEASKTSPLTLCTISPPWSEAVLSNFRLNFSLARELIHWTLPPGSRQTSCNWGEGVKYWELTALIYRITREAESCTWGNDFASSVFRGG